MTPSDNEGLREDVQLLEAIDNILVPDGYSKTVLEREGEFRQRVTITPDTAEKLMALISQKIIEAYAAIGEPTLQDVGLMQPDQYEGGKIINEWYKKRIATLTTKQDTKASNIIDHGDSVEIVTHEVKS
jgi:hypothetical protein